MTDVLGIDPSTAATGLACPGGECRTITVKAGADEPARRLSEIDELFRRYLGGIASADVAVIELVPIHGVQPLAKIRLAELGGVLRLALYEHAIPFVEVNPMSLKKWATGKGTAQKDEMVKAAKNAGATVSNDNEADAFWLRDIGEKYYEWPPSQWNILEKHQQELLDKLVFPRVRSGR